MVDSASRVLEYVDTEFLRAPSRPRTVGPISGTRIVTLKVRDEKFLPNFVSEEVLVIEKVYNSHLRNMPNQQIKVLIEID